MPAQLTLAARVVLDALGFNREMKKAGQSVAGMDDRTRRANASARRFARGMGQLRVETQAAGNSFNSAHGKLLRYAGGFGGIGAAGAAFRSVTRASIRQEQALAQVEARLRSTGYAAGLASEQLAAIAADLQDVTTYGDEATLEIQALLLSFRGIDGRHFARTTALSQDLAAALGQDLRSAALQLGKALDDPILGLTALQRSGTTFSAAQKELIHGLVETGRKAEAQGLILDELAIQYGGSAEAARNTLGGALQALGNRFGDLTELSSASTSGLREHIDGLNAALKSIDVSELHQSLGRIAQVAGYAAAAFGVYGAAALTRWGYAAAAAQVSTSGLGASALAAAARTDVARLRLAAGAVTARRYAGAMTLASKATRGFGRALSLLAGPIGFAAFAAYSIYQLAANTETGADRLEGATRRLDALTRKNELLRKRLASGDPPDVAARKEALDAQRGRVDRAAAALAAQIEAESRDTSHRGLFGPTSKKARDAEIESLRAALAEEKKVLAAAAENADLAAQTRARQAAGSAPVTRTDAAADTAGAAAQKKDARDLLKLMRALETEEQKIQRAYASSTAEIERLTEAGSRRRLELLAAAKARRDHAAAALDGSAALKRLTAENKRLEEQTGQTGEQVERTNRAHERELELARTYPGASDEVVRALGEQYAARDRLIDQQRRGVNLRERFDPRAIHANAALDTASLDTAGLDPAARLEAQAVIELEAERDLQEQRLAIKRVYWDQELIERAGYRDREAQAAADHEKALLAQNSAISLPGQRAVLQAGIDLRAQSGVQQVAAAAKIATQVTAAGAQQSKKGFELHQKTQIASAIISTYAAANEAFRIGGGFPVGAALAAATIAIGLANVAQIRAQQPPQAFARGGIVDSPTFFQARGISRGVAGEAGPEAILPLRRGRGGRLGVEASGSRSVVLHLTVAPTTNVTVADPADADALGERLGAVAADTTYAVIVQESRPGGLLDYARA